MTAPLPGNSDRAARGGPAVRVGEIVPRALARILAPSLRFGDLPASERPYQRLVNLGPDALTYEELVAVMIGTARDCDMVDGAARELLTQACGSVRRLAAMSASSLQAVRGIGPRRAAQLHAGFELARRCLTETVEERPLVRSVGDVIAHLEPYLRHLSVAQLRLVVLDAQLGIAEVVLLCSDFSCLGVVTAGEVFRAAIAAGAASIILIHSHPGDPPTLSQEEVEFARAVAIDGRQTDIPLQDLIVIGRNCYQSLQERRCL